MDESFKSLWTVIIMFVSLLLLVTCLTYYIMSAKARKTMYEIVEYLEIYGYQSEVIDRYADETGMTIQVTPLEVEEGYRYEVEVSFSHVFYFIGLNRRSTVSNVTRAVDY